MRELRGDGVLLRPAETRDYADWAGLREAKPRFSDALGADLAGR